MGDEARADVGKESGSALIREGELAAAAWDLLVAAMPAQCLAHGGTLSP